MEFDFSPVEDLAKVPDAFRPLYGTAADEDGKFCVQPSLKVTADAINGFNKAAKSLRAELKTSRVDLSPLAAYGDSPMAIADAVKQAVETAGASRSNDVNKAVESAKAAMTAAHQKDVERHSARATGLQNQLYTMLVDNAATTAILEMKGAPVLLLPAVRSQVKIVETNGELMAIAVDAQGEVRYGATGSPMSVKELVSELRSNEQFARAFDSDRQTGGGGMHPGAGRQQQRAAPKDLSSTAKIAAGLAQGLVTSKVKDGRG